MAVSIIKKQKDMIRKKFFERYEDMCVDWEEVKDDKK